MSSRHHGIASVAAAWLTMTAVAAAEPAVTPADVPTGDVWMTPGASASLPPGTGQAGSVNAQLPIGDVWLADDGVSRAAEAPAPPQRETSAREEIAAGGIK
jgi:hypothetical protein